MIYHKTRDSLDTEKYDACIQEAFNSRIFAYSWYLDSVCDAWDILVEEDYKAVMPLPKRKKLGIQYIYLPPWTQQLGIFSRGEVNEKKVNRFLQSIPKNYKFININLNTGNLYFRNNCVLRHNYILPLNQPYALIYKQFRKGRKSAISKAGKLKLQIIENYNSKKIIELFKSNKGKVLRINELDYEILEDLVQQANFLGKMKSIAVLSEMNALIGGAIFFEDNGRITYLFSAMNDEGRQKQAMSYLIAHIIQQKATTNTILDFEGSMIHEIALFFRSFGAIDEPYKQLVLCRGILKYVQLLKFIIKPVK